MSLTSKATNGSVAVLSKAEGGVLINLCISLVRKEVLDFQAPHFQCLSKLAFKIPEL